MITKLPYLCIFVLLAFFSSGCYLASPGKHLDRKIAKDIAYEGGCDVPYSDGNDRLGVVRYTKSGVYFVPSAGARPLSADEKDALLKSGIKMNPRADQSL
jgi:hypothetical protein